MIEVAALKKALSEAEDKVAKERIEREKQEARVDEFSKRSGISSRNTSPWSVTLRRKSPSLRRPSRAHKTPSVGVKTGGSRVGGPELCVKDGW